MSPLVLMLLACRPDPEPAAPAPDLTERLPAGAVRAGVVTDAAALFGGLSAEGQVGDVKIYNDRAMFIIQGERPGDYYIATGGGVVDADIVRPEGQPGRDVVDEWQAMAGLGRLQRPDKITIVEDGRAGRAWVRVEGGEVPMALITGALESPDFIPELGLQVTTDYILSPDSPLLEVITTITAAEEDVSLIPGDLLIAAADAARGWRSQAGFDNDADAPSMIVNGAVGTRNEGAWGIVAPAGGELASSAAGELLQSVVNAASSFGETLTIEEGASASFRRFYGVGDDVAALTDDWLTRSEAETQTVSGVVEADDGPVAGAMVTVLVDGAPYTLAVTDADGRYEALAPAAGVVTTLAVGRGTGLHRDLPAGAAPYSPYTTEANRAAALASLSGGATPIAQAEGRGLSTAEAPDRLGVPATLTVRAADGLPFELRLEGGSDGDRRVDLGRPYGRAALAWTADGEVSLPVEPGSYTLLAWRGQRYELVQRGVDLVAGEETVIDVTLTAAYELDGWMIGDPHSHAAPSGDGGIPMEDRLLVAAGVGVGLHFGTDHDHVADYAPLLTPLGLDGQLNTVLADEVSPPPRGHINAWPLESGEGSNGGAWLWWEREIESTDAMFVALREHHPGVVLQMNHPLDSGVAAAAGWSPGKVSDSGRWAEDFDAVEVLNDGEHEGYFDFWLDTINRGILSAPVGVSDSHRHLAGGPGVNVTYLHMSGDPASYSPDALRDVIRRRATIASFGVFLDMDLVPGSTLTGAGP
ncbi:hypothetical protein L6R49_29640, partial [Myxococcota bacterium]|nr:hypothetical protein [Myxococcota bacterium]